MTTRKRALTAQIKPDTRNAIMDQLALAADENIRLRGCLTAARRMVSQEMARKIESAMYYTPDEIEGEPPRRWWHRWLK